MSRLLPSQLTEEEILALLDSDEVEDDTAQIFDYKDDVVPFMGFYKITPGHNLVSKKLLYKLYKAYSKQPLDNLNFNIQLGQYLQPAANHFHINQDTFAISQAVYQAEKTRDKTKAIVYQKHFDWFITEGQVQKGTFWIEGFILFYIYKDFCKQRRVSPKLGYVNFHKFLKLHYPYRRIKENRSLFFRVDEKTAKTFTEEDCVKIREARTKKARGREEVSKSESEEAKTE